MKVETIIKELDLEFPRTFAMDWDNPGLQVGSSRKEVKKVLAKLEKEPEKQIESHQFKEEPEQSSEQEDKQEPPQHKPFTPKL